MGIPPNLAVEADEDLEALVDPRELSRFKARDRGEAGERRFLAHLLERAPHSILARLMSARLAEDMEDRLRFLDEGMRLGMLRWAPELLALNPEPDWPRDRHARMFVTCVVEYGRSLGESGMLDEASRCYGLLRRLDPDDELGARMEAQDAGWLDNASEVVLADASDFQASIVRR